MLQEAVTNGDNYSEAQQVILLHSCLDALLHSRITAISSIALWSRLKAKFEPKSKNGFMCFGLGDDRGERQVTTVCVHSVVSPGPPIKILEALAPARRRIRVPKLLLIL